jgi:hypothetical protein
MKMRRAWVLPLTVLALVGTAHVALAAETAPARTWAVVAPVPVTVPQGSVAQPANLLALEQKMGELKVTSLRFSEQTSVTVPHNERKLGSLLKLLLGADSGTSGEVTTSSPASDVTLSFFGHPLTLRLVGGTTYLYFRALAAKDRGRPWIKLGHGGFAELITVNGKHAPPSKTAGPKIGEPTLLEPPFEGVRKVLSGAREVRELGSGTLYGQPVTSFLAILAPEQLEHEHLASAAQLRLPAPQPTTPQPPTATMEVSFAQNGLPVRTVITEHSSETVTSATLDIPAINFPLTIEPPPAAQTITIQELRKLGRKARKRSHHHARH